MGTAAMIVAHLKMTGLKAATSLLRPLEVHLPVRIGPDFTQHCNNMRKKRAPMQQ